MQRGSVTLGAFAASARLKPSALMCSLRANIIGRLWHYAHHQLEPDQLNISLEKFVDELRKVDPACFCALREYGLHIRLKIDRHIHQRIGLEEFATGALRKINLIWYFVLLVVWCHSGLANRVSCGLVRCMLILMPFGACRRPR
jgi:hypothetical protein